MSSNGSTSHAGYHRLTLTGLIITLGIIYGDIGTSPLYVMRAIVGEGVIDRETILGAVSLVFWTLTIQTTLKYVLLVLQADNNGEGGIFSMYTLVRRRRKWLLYPAMIGGAAVLSEGMITPPISVSSAIEGLGSVQQLQHVEIPTVQITVGILLALFLFQQFGTATVGRFFGPIMLVWFSMLGTLGGIQVANSPSVLSAIDPRNAFHLLTHHPNALVLMGAVFLCTTGAEALYADLGHCGKQNIRVSWIFVKICLLLNYFGQAAWCLEFEGMRLPESTPNPFYGIMPAWFLPLGITIATLAAIIASQAMISGSFTLVSEAIRLGLLPKLKVVFPSNMKGQLYLPAVNTLLLVGCLFITLYFKESARMEAAYGLSVTITMLMSTILMSNFLIMRRVNPALIWIFLIGYLGVEGSFFTANLLKFVDGGFITIVIAFLLFALMYVWVSAKKIKKRFLQNVDIRDYIDQIIMLSNDETVPKYATNLVFLSNAKSPHKVEEKILYSILQTQPKRADVYWFVHIQVTDEPYTMEYKVKVLAPNEAYKVIFRLGFRVEQRMNLFLRKVVEDLIESGELTVQARYHFSPTELPTGDFKFVIIQEFLSHENDLPVLEQIIMSIYLGVKSFTASPQNWFGLDSDSVVIEKAPLVLRPVKGLNLQRVGWVRP
ncbi:MAG: KUP/HAK/KT family potassium transporter [Saprospiraceae bacterium]|nr:KUP/HAK/KT family potassium transporter [Saprospiraceae bacterium]MDW8484291.1 KUP/HAK/KT family potassium transporter [Saprospiraceae bacterium]